MKTTVEEQAKQAFINLGSILKEVEMTYDNVVKTTVFYNICLILAKLTKSMGITFQKFCLHVLCRSSQVAKKMVYLKLKQLLSKDNFKMFLRKKDCILY